MTKVKKAEVQVEIDHEALLAEKVQLFNNQVSKLEKELVEYALEHGLSLYLGDYGTGRSLIREDNHWSGKDKGDWVYSSESC